MTGTVSWARQDNNVAERTGRPRVPFDSMRAESLGRRLTFLGPDPI